MGPAIFSVVALRTSQPIASAIIPVTAGISGANNLPFSIVLRANDRIRWEVIGLFTLGATGGFRFLANGPAAPTTYNAQYNIDDLSSATPAVGGRFVNGQVAEADFANASAVATTYQLKAHGTFLNGANAGTFAFQFAQNTSDALPITLLAGATFAVWQF
jgi:hypothetical protein